jgi:hypothetical protein
LFRHLLLQIGGANIENPPTSSALVEEIRLNSLLLSTAARDYRRSQLGPELLAHRALSIAR